MEIQFLGGADTVTGSQHLIQVNGNQLLRDCGLFQGKRKLANEYNRELLFNPANLDALLLSHAHVDHCGNIPSAVAQGYEGPIYATTATAKLCEIMLQDAAKIQEQDAEYLNQKTSRRGLPPVEPLYRTEDALKALQLFRGHDYGSVQELVPGITSLSLEPGTFWVQSSRCSPLPGMGDPFVSDSPSTSVVRDYPSFAILNSWRTSTS